MTFPAEKPRLSLLDDSLIEVRLRGGDRQWCTLPRVLALMGERSVMGFPAVQPHQRVAWHQFLVQIAAMALHLRGEHDPDWDEPFWRDALLCIASGVESAWCLIAPEAGPAFMQPPLPAASPDFSEWQGVQSPDRLDVLISAKSHEIKPGRVRNAQPQDWLFALVSLQTHAPFFGSGNWGVSRMSGGFSCRALVGLYFTADPGGMWCEDVLAALQSRAQLVARYGLAAEGGLPLLWLAPWDGKLSIKLSHLDPFYVEIARRVRMVQTSEGILAYTLGTEVMRVDCGDRPGMTGDLWAPISRSDPRPLSIGPKGFSGALLGEILFQTEWEHPVAISAKLGADAQLGPAFIWASALARTNGRTLGFHDHLVPVGVTTVFAIAEGGEAWRNLACAFSYRLEGLKRLRGAVWRSVLEVLAVDAEFPGLAGEHAAALSDEVFKEEDERLLIDLLSDASVAQIESDPALANQRWADLVVARALVRVGHFLSKTHLGDARGQVFGERAADRLRAAVSGGGSKK